MAQHRVRLRADAVRTRMNALGYDSESAQARAIGVVPSIHHRALKGDREPSAFYALRLLGLLAPNLREEIETFLDLDLDFVLDLGTVEVEVTQLSEPEAVAS
ncbi:hypothetical protein [Nonomuraea sp. SYSU D8015]|uniref:hypothetical protein n=1 Tax=Nonomuraea sp. SYSU D8015 TaxID=2593644 RepID=UPI0016614A7B|nr:hypothetical protein [Nonomuraea sp. SYSU D8015]